MKLRLWYAIVGSALTASCSPGPDDPSQGYTITYLTRPTVTHGVHGIKIKRDGDLLVGDVLGFTLWKVNVATGDVVPIVGPPYGCADDIALAADGTIAWTSLLTGHVYGPRPGGGRYVIAEGLIGVNSIGFSPDGRLFVTQLAGHDKLWQLDLNGIEAREFGQFAVGWRSDRLPLCL